MKLMKSFLILTMLFAAFVANSQIIVSGTIVSDVDNKGIQGAHVSLSGQAKHTFTDDKGFFSLNVSSTGNYLLRVSHIAYQTILLYIDAPLDKPLSISLSEAHYLNEEVVVKAGRVLTGAPLSYSNVESKQIEKLNFGTDLPYLLQATPSIVVSSDAGTGIGYTGLRIRGSDLTRINVTLNGVPVNDAESHGVFFVDLPDLASSIDNIQIQRGAGTSSNGAAAFGASINIKTRMVEEEAGGLLHSAAGSFNTFKNTIGFSTGRSNNGLALTGRLSQVKSDGYINRGWSDLKSYYMAGSWSSNKTLISLLATSGLQSTYQAWYGIPKDSLKTNRKYNPSGEITGQNGTSEGYYPNQTDNYQQDYYQIHLAHKINPLWYFSAAAFLTNGKGYYESWKNNQKFSNYGITDIVLGDTSLKKTDLIQQKWLDNSFYGFHATLQTERSRLNSSFGIGLNQYDGDHYGHIIWARFYPDGAFPIRWYDNTGLKTDFNVFGKMNYHLTEKLSLYGDVQYRFINYRIKGIHDDLRDISQQHRFNFINPKAGLLYAWNQQTEVYASVSVSNREPNRSVYRDADPGQQITFENLINYELGYSFKKGWFSWLSNLYFMDYRNQLVLTGKINNVGAPIMTNVPQSYRLGIENVLSGSIFKNLEYIVHLSLSTNKILSFTEYVDNWNYWDDPDNEPYQYSFERGTTNISFSPEAIAGGTLNYAPVKSISIMISSNYVSRQYLDNSSSKSRSLDPYFVSNFIVTYTIPQKMVEALEVSIAVNNLTNTVYENNGWVYKYYYNQQEYTLDGYFPQAGIHGMAGLKIRF
jgi:iron complex outermembrane receptor protein